VHIRGLTARGAERGPKPNVPDSVVLARELIGEFLSYSGTDSGIFRYFFRYFRRHHAGLFPNFLKIDRTNFVRQAANLWKMKEKLHKHLQRQIDGDPLAGDC
jgi:hypothetical protein